MSLALTIRPVGRPKHESRLHTPDATTRVPARVSEATHDDLRELCVVLLKRPLEIVIGEWIEDRLPAELDAARKARDKAKGITPPAKADKPPAKRP